MTATKPHEYSPYYMVFGQRPRRMIDVKYGVMKQSPKKLKKTKLTTTIENTAKRLLDRYKSNMSVKNKVDIKPNDEVLIQIIQPSNRNYKRWKGPYVVNEVLSPMNITVKGSNKVHNIRNVKKFIRRQGDELLPIGTKVKIYWDGNKEYYEGKIIGYSFNDHYWVKYKDDNHIHLENPQAVTLINKDGIMWDSEFNNLNS